MLVKKTIVAKEVHSESQAIFIMQEFVLFATTLSIQSKIEGGSRSLFWGTCLAGTCLSTCLSTCLGTCLEQDKTRTQERAWEQIQARAQAHAQANDAHFSDDLAAAHYWLAQAVPMT